MLSLMHIEPFPHGLNPRTDPARTLGITQNPSCTHTRNPSASAAIVSRAVPSTPKRQYSSPPCVPS